MKKVRISVMLFMLSAGMFAFTSCGGGETPTENGAEVTTEQTESSAEVDANEDANAVTLEIESDDKMKFNLSELRVKAGQEVTLVLKHVGSLPKASMGHNLIVLQAGVDVADFAKSAIAARDNEYIPADREGDIIAHTKLIGGGETDEITFTAPEAGEYDFICSFPGHSSMMKGKFIVE